MYYYRYPALLTCIITGIAALAWAPAPPQQVSWAAPREAAAIVNPLVVSSTILADAKTIYMSNCTPCHGNSGRGDGPAAQALTPKPADHTSAAVQSDSDGTLFWKITTGRNPMPSYKTTLNDQQRWELVLYIRTLARNKKK